MRRRRPLQSSGIETIGWLDVPRLLPRTLFLGGMYLVRIGPCWAAWLLRGRRLQPGTSSLILAPPPTMPWAQEVDKYVEEIGMKENTPIFRHSRRTWQFASALAEIDDVKLDPELLYVGS